MLKTLFVAVVGIAAVTGTAAMAGCDGGADMARGAVLKDLSKKIPKAKQACKVSVGEKTDTKDGEDYHPVAKCAPNRTFIYHVELLEEEDAVCHVKSVSRVGASG